jgi:hypothetical protein
LIAAVKNLTTTTGSLEILADIFVEPAVGNHKDSFVAQKLFI